MGKFLSAVGATSIVCTYGVMLWAAADSAYESIRSRAREEGYRVYRSDYESCIASREGKMPRAVYLSDVDGDGAKDVIILHNDKSSTIFLRRGSTHVRLEAVQRTMSVALEDKVTENVNALILDATKQK